MSQGIYTEKFVVRYSEVDMFNILKIRSVFDYLQQVAATHAVSLGCGWDNMKENKQLWVLQRMSLEIKKAVGVGDELIVRTYPSGRERLFFRREFEVLDGAGDLVLVGSSYWLVLDGSTLRPVRNFNFDISPELEGLPKFCDYDNELKISAEEIEKMNYSHEFQVNYSSIDVNLHLNNANYPMLVQDVLYNSLQRSCQFKKIQIAFNMARKFGENIKIYSTIDNDKFKVVGVTDEGKIIFESAGIIA
ncbi:MAG: hypothetical protein IJW31_09945 [Lentisphaeria bacterium]|nr:hypothetical protein [Lentisphaeria bacterium]